MPDVDSLPPKKSRKGCWIALGVLALPLIAGALFYGPAIADFLRVYGVESLMKPEKHKYAATSEKNLKAIYQGMMLFHESEGKFPEGAKWMDEITNRLKTNDLAKGEAEKKLIRPDLVGKTGEFGYALNRAAAGKYKEDITEPGKTPLVYESKNTARNASGDPATDRNGMAIAVDGTILR